MIPFHTALPGQVRVETLPRDAAAGARASLVLLSSPDIGDYAFEVVLVRSAGPLARRLLERGAACDRARPSGG